MANTLRYGFWPHGGMHTTVQVTLAGTVTKGDLLSYDGSGAFVTFAPASMFLIDAVALESGVSGDVISAVLIDETTVLEVATSLTFAAATHLYNAYDVTGTTGAQYLGTGTTYRHFRIIGQYSRPGATGAGANANVLVKINTLQQFNRRRLKLERTTATLSGAYTIGDVTPSQIYVLDPGGSARNVTLPSEEVGAFFLIVNSADAAENLVIKGSDGSTTVCTIGQNEAAVITCDGTSYVAAGLGTAAV